MNRRDFLLSTSALALSPSLSTGQEKAHAASTAKGDIVFADFENGTYDGWTLEGNCWTPESYSDRYFPGKITGFQGKRFLCTLHPTLGSAAKGKAISKEFTIEKPFLTFKIGGGNYPREACLNLVVDGKIVRTETGNDSAELSPAYWDVYALMGKKAHLEIVDSTASTNRGYIMVDDIIFTERPNTPLQNQIEKMVLMYQKRYDYPAVWVAVSVRGKIVAAVADGLRRKDRPEKVSIHDKLMIGSVSKSVTGTLIGILIDKGMLRWDTTFREIFPELARQFNRPWLDATVLQFSIHLSGSPAYPQNGFHSSSNNKKDLRYQYVRDLLATPEIGIPGKKYQYG